MYSIYGIWPLVPPASCWRTRWPVSRTYAARTATPAMISSRTMRPVSSRSVRPPIAQQRQRDAQSRSGDARPGIGIGKEQQPRKRGVNGAERYECDGERAGTVAERAEREIGVERRHAQQQHKRGKQARVDAVRTVERGEGQTWPPQAGGRHGGAARRSARPRGRTRAAVAS